LVQRFQRRRFKCESLHLNFFLVQFKALQNCQISLNRIDSWLHMKV
jgi:hypothetical protein